MIEISHRQAQRMIRQEVDGQLPQEAWATLQSHLEGCAECRAYQVNLTRAERGLLRALRHHWNTVRGPNEGLPAQVIKARARRKDAARISGYVGFGLAAVLLFTLYLGFRRANAPLATPTPVPPWELMLTPSPTPPRITFQGVAVMEANGDGNQEIYLMTTNSAGSEPELVNLTDHPATDSDPIWSPDGEWIAFLSDRTGKTEVFVMHVAGSRLTQVTDEPEVAWQGPMSWSADGEWLALTSTRESANGLESRRMVFLVPVGGTEQVEGPRSLGLTGDARGTVKFSTTQALLAYDSGAPGSDLMLYNQPMGWYTPVTWLDNNQQGMRTAVGGSFDWSPDGRRLVYLAEGTGEAAAGVVFSQVRATGGLDQYVSQLYYSGSNQVVESQPQAGTYRSAAWVPGTDPDQVVFLRDEPGSDCWTVHVRHIQSVNGRTRDLEGLCVEGNLSSASFSPDGRWLVAAGHLPGIEERGLFALRMPADQFSLEPVLVERLVDLPVDAEAVDFFEARVRPKGPVREISPRPADPSAAPAAAAAPEDLSGSLAYTVLDGDRPGSIHRVGPDGSGETRLPGGEEAENSCPVWSPDRTRLAFLSDRSSQHARVNEVFVMDPDGQNTRQLTQPVFPYAENQEGASGSVSPRYDCPVWSPDGTRLAAVIRTSRGSFLALIPVDEGGGVSYQQVSAPSYTSAPLWTADGQSVLMVYQRDGLVSPRIVVIDLSGEQGVSAQSRVLVESDGWADVYGVALSPDGQQVVYLAAFAHANQPTTFQMHLVWLDGSRHVVLGEMPESDFNDWLGDDSLVWLPDGRITFLTRHRMDAKYKTDLHAVTLKDDQVFIQNIYSFEEVVYNLAWSPEGRWLAYTSESGLWLLNAAGEGLAPYQLNTGRVYDLSWK